ncbi:hypothetical protein [Virgibacillus oceani]|uniref:hypothetical protein n=1 Tax=Virgibacillus oceani TaxID=1479511 RepID=UPI001669FA43|nr:hypothetical protein [Virgibacillus oceani]
MTWNREWINEFESPWGIFEKFKYANAASVKDIFCLFGTKEVRQLQSSPGKLHRNLTTLDGIEEQLISKSLAYPVKKTHYQNIASLFGVLSHDKSDINKYFYNHLVFCKHCISIGYHSLFHQFLLISKCPYHNTPLIKECPTCGREIPYILSDEYTDPPFTCKCGYSLIEKHTRKMNFSIWKEAKKLSVKDSSIKKWLSLDKSADNLCKIYFFQSQNLKTDHIIKHLIWVLNSGPIDRKNGHHMVHVNSYRKGASQAQRVEFYTFSFKIYKSIARHLKKTLLKNHITCIARLKRKAPDKEMCPYAYAFVNWRKNLEGLNHYSDSENGLKYKRHSEPMLEFTLKQNNITLKDLIEDIKVTFPKTARNHQLIWVINKIIPILILNHFYNWLAISKEFASNNLITHYTPFGYECMPYFVMEFSKKEGEGIKLSYKDPIYINLGQKLANLICPFSSMT